MQEGTIQVGVMVRGRKYGNVDFPVGKLDVQRHGNLIIIRIEPAKAFSGEVGYSEIFMPKDIAVRLYQEMEKAVGHLAKLAEEEAKLEEEEVKPKWGPITKLGILAVLASIFWPGDDE